MILKIKYTQPLLFQGQVRKTFEHDVECSDTETFANGIAKPVDTKWNSILETMHLTVHENSPKYEIV